MLKDFAYHGIYRNKGISVSIMLENPLDHNLTADALTFCISLESRDKNADMPTLEDFTFYVMDEANRLHNVKTAPYLRAIIKEDNEPIRNYRIIHTEFKPELLFQNLRIVFYHQVYNQMQIIQLEH